MPSMKRQHHQTSAASSGASCQVPDNYQKYRDEIIAATDTFLKIHSLRLKVRKLPLPVDDLSAAPMPHPTSSSLSTHIPSDASTSVTDSTTTKQTTSPTAPADSTTSASASNNINPPPLSLPIGMSPFPFPAYHFVTRQKRHMNEQLLRNHSQYLTAYNSKTHHRNAKSPFILRTMPEVVLEGLMKLSSDFDDPEFSGVWLSLHTHPFVTDTEFGNLARSKIVGWALIEVLTTNERCLKALWVHPKLGAASTTNLLRGFLPRVMIEAFELGPPPDASCLWKFFYLWVNDLDSLPRQTWLILTCRQWLGLPRHYDNVDHSVKGHVDVVYNWRETSGGAVGEGESGGGGSGGGSEAKEGGKEGEDEGGAEGEGINGAKAESGGDSGGTCSNRDINNLAKRGSCWGTAALPKIDILSHKCECARTAKWDNTDSVLVGCSEAALYEKWRLGGFTGLVPLSECSSLVREIDMLPREKAEDPEETGSGDGGGWADSTFVPESEEEIREAELLGMEGEELGRLLKYLWGGSKGKGRIKDMDEYVDNAHSYYQLPPGEAPIATDKGGGGGGGGKKRVKAGKK
eukprot:GHVQ01017793.1.p1 GENE.GHVQ01017793.1~~GHVQ01017793.1.p1  ORF type:complete len:574 (-),score=108.81 GHVQ01017793.1:1427-3148(-)